ncbi:Copper chaperone CopZ [Paramicrobacterium humi]|uniref:Copper chaperone CopZ n=1 Tax=Paramicrobacterium humi TaxID=640635 RepID=A0A1H4JQU5_9MICO|nr:heavy metal-associated domain-containing protein [Microbacterium humi]SEB48704.1 Copper chaperone CopZ [Microbacterium humi]
MTTATRTVLRSSEFTCPSCVGKIEKALRRVEGVSEATVHFETGRIDVEHDPVAAPVDDLVATVAAAGYRAAPSAF